MAKIKKAQNGLKKAPTPTYKNLRMGVNADNKSAGNTYEQKPTKADSASYRFGYNRGLAGKGPDPSETNTVRGGRWEGQNTKGAKKKMKNGGSLTGLKASNKRVGPVDPKGAYTKVQEKTLAGAKGKATLKKDKPLGATKMKKGGLVKKK